MDYDHRPPKRRATSYDVAALAGVSQSAVSRCFKPGASISGKTREKVLKAASELGYQPNAIARGLITQRSNMAAVIVSAQLNFYYPEVLFQLTQHFADRGMRVILFTAESPDDIHQALDEMWRYQVDCVVSASYLLRNHYQVLEDRGIPTVLFNRYFSDVSTNAVWCDPTSATQKLIDMLVKQGHQDFAMIDGPEQSQVGLIRRAAVDAALAKHALSFVATARGNYRYDSAAGAVDALRGAPQSFTALICANDMMAMGAIDHLRGTYHCNVPTDVSVAGFDGLGAGQFASYQLTTIQQPIDQMSARAVDILFSTIADEEKSLQNISFPGELIVGASTA